MASRRRVGGPDPSNNNAAAAGHSSTSPGRTTAQDKKGHPPSTAAQVIQGDYAAMTASARAHQELVAAIRPENTSRAYDSKKIEFRRFCEAVFAHEPERERCIVTPQKAFMFLWYHAHRPKRSAARNRPGDESDDEGDGDDDDDERRVPPFNREEYRELIRVYGNQDRTLAPPSPIGSSGIRGYSGAVRDVWADQRQRGVNSVTWEEINNATYRGLMKTVASREARAKHTKTHHLAPAPAPAADPLHVVSMDAVLPGIANRLDQLQAALNQAQVGSQEQMSQLASSLQQILEKITTVSANVEWVMQNMQRHAQLYSSVSAAFDAFESGSQRAPVRAPPPPPLPPPVPAPRRAGAAAAGASEKSSAGAAAPWLPRARLPGDGARLSDRHASFGDLFDEYCGFGRHESKPVEGGFRALERARGTAWRKCYSNSERSHFLRVKRVVESVLTAGEESEGSVVAVSQRVSRYDELYGEAEAKVTRAAKTDRKIGVMMSLLRREGFLEEPQKRKRAPPGNEQEGQAP